MSDFDFGMVGLGTMGKALLLNMADHGFKVAGFDTDPVKAGALQGDNVHGFSDLAEFVKAIRKPRAIMMLVPAGGPVDDVISKLQPLLEPGDFLIDGGNSYYRDTARREEALRNASFGFIGMGVSGGEAGARRGPSMMPGGTPENYERIRPILEAVAAKHDGQACVALMGSGAAGHYVKTVHNGIEYGMMQLIAETYDLLKHAGHSNADIAKAFAEWNQGEQEGFLVEITNTVLSYKDQETGKDLVDLISDKAKSKGTGKWTSQDAMDLGLPIPTVDASVSAREVSGYKEQRVAISAHIGGTQPVGLSVENLGEALRVSSLLSYVQGLSQIHAASEEYGYGTDLKQVIRVWRAGCIIRSRLLDRIGTVINAQPTIPNLLLDADFAKEIQTHSSALRQVVAAAVVAGIPAPAFSASLAYLDSIRSERVPANLIQGLRDLFGAHTYERLDKPGSFHTQWESGANK